MLCVRCRGRARVFGCVCLLLNSKATKKSESRSFFSQQCCVETQTPTKWADQWPVAVNGALWQRVWVGRDRGSPENTERGWDSRIGVCVCVCVCVCVRLGGSGSLGRAIRWAYIASSREVICKKRSFMARSQIQLKPALKDNMLIAPLHSEGGVVRGDKWLDKYRKTSNEAEIITGVMFVTWREQCPSDVLAADTCSELIFLPGSKR